MNELIQISPKHPTCNIEERGDFTLESVKERFPKSYIMVAEYTDEDQPQYNHTAYIVGKDKEEAADCYFKANQRLKYCNGSSYSVSLEEQAFYQDRFFGEGGIGNYARMGGNMD